MRTQTVLVVLLALGFGGIAAVGVLAFGGPGKPEGPAMATIIVAAADLPRGEMITTEAVIARPYPKDLLPPGVLTKLEDAVGRSTLIPLVKDEPVIDGKLAPKGAGRGLSSLIKKGMRAVTLPIPNVSTGVAGFIIPGSRVDIHWSPASSSHDATASLASPPLLEDVEVLAVDEKIDAPAANRMDSGPVKSVTVQVKPEEIARLSPALSNGFMHLSLRNPGDSGRSPPKPVAEVTPVALAPAPPPSPPPPAAPPPPPPPRVLRTFRGAQEGPSYDFSQDKAKVASVRSDPISRKIKSFGPLPVEAKPEAQPGPVLAP